LKSWGSRRDPLPHRCAQEHALSTIADPAILVVGAGSVCVWPAGAAVLTCDSAAACQASSASRARRVVLAGAAVLALACVAVVAIVGGEAVKTGHVRMELSDQNEFESSPAWCARNS